MLPGYRIRSRPSGLRRGVEATVFVGHFGIANALAEADPRVPPLVAYAGVGFPDLLWGALVLLGVERARIDPQAPPHARVRFDSYPYSHALVLTNLIAVVPAAVVSLATGTPAAGAVFLIGSISHWLLDVVVHGRDLPVLGFGTDRKVGWGLWRWPAISFPLEFALYALPTWAFVHGPALWRLLIAGAAFHLLNVLTFFGGPRRRRATARAGSVRSYALVVLAGYAAVAWALHGMVR